jgi:hypothetical protein
MTVDLCGELDPTIAFRPPVPPVEPAGFGADEAVVGFPRKRDYCCRVAVLDRPDQQADRWATGGAPNTTSL